METVIILLISLFVGYLTWWFIKLQNVKKKLPKYFGPRPIPILGNIIVLKSLVTDFADFFPRLKALHQEYGDIFFMSVGTWVYGLSITDQTFVEYLLQSNTVIEKADSYKFLSKWLGSGLLLAAGERWKKHRKLFTPTFHFKILEKFVQAFESPGNILIAKLNEEVDKGSVDIYPFINLCTLDIICETAMGTSVNAQKSKDSKYVACVKEMCKLIFTKSLNIIHHFPSLSRFTSLNRKQQDYLKVLHGYTNSVIQQRKKQCEKDLSMTGEESEQKKKFALLDLMLRMKVDGRPMPDEHIREEVDTFMFAGHDTTTSAISFTLYCIANHFNVQNKIVNELREIFGKDKTRPALYNDLQEMKYLEMVIKESLRLYPPVPLYGRKVGEDTKFYDGVLPKGLNIIILVYLMHRNPKVYPDPERFDPERFTSENQSKRHPFAYIPFSAGPRNCIGQKFAMLELKSIISKILRHYELFPAIPEHKVQIVPEAVLTSANGICLGLKNRDF